MLTVHHVIPDTLAAAAAAKSLQLCPILCDPIDLSPPDSTIPGILQARPLEWVAISFSNAWKWKVKVKSLSCVRLLETPWTAAYQAPRPWDFPDKSLGVGCHCFLRLNMLRQKLSFLEHIASRCLPSFIPLPTSFFSLLKLVIFSAYICARAVCGGCGKSLHSFRHQPLIFSIGQFAQKLLKLFYVIEGG